MRERLGHSFVKRDGANCRYNDPLFDDKRLWVARLLAQFLRDDAIILSVDESAFHAVNNPAKHWQCTKRGQKLR